MKRTYKYRLVANKATFKNAEEWLYLCCCLYNTALQQRILIYKQNKGNISQFSQNNQLPELKKEFPSYRNISSHTLQDVIERLDMAYRTFFLRIKRGKDKPGFPRFKSLKRYDSFTLKKVGWKLDGKYLIVRNIGRFKLRLSRPIVGEIKTITIRREGDKWYASFSLGDIPEREFAKVDSVVGIDMGIKSFLVDSEGEIVDNPKYFRQAEALLRRRNRVMARRSIRSNRRNDARILVAKSFEKVRNQRHDFLHKLSTKYINNYGILVFENLNIKDMAKNHCLAKSIDDCSWGKFYKLCAYKAEEAGRQIVRIPPHYTSKTCSNCGAISHDLTLNDRQWMCKECGVLHDRDYNAAKNIKRVGQTQQALTCGNTQSVVCESPCNMIGECQRSRSFSNGVEIENT